MDHGFRMWSMIGRLQCYLLNHRRHLPIRMHICLKEMRKRPTEVTFEFPQPPMPYPPYQRSGALIGPSGWKDHNCHRNDHGTLSQRIFARICVSPNCAPKVDPAWDAFRKHVRMHMQVPDDEQTMWDTWEPAVLEKLIERHAVLEKLIERHKKVNAHLKANTQERCCYVMHS